MSENEDEYKIVEPESPKKKRDAMKEVAEKIRKARDIEDGLRVDILLSKPLDKVDSDSLFNMGNRFDENMCMLTKLPCKNPHCTSCNIVLLNGNDAKRLSDRYIDEYIKLKVREVKDELPQDTLEEISHWLGIINEIIEKKE